MIVLQGDLANQASAYWEYDPMAMSGILNFSLLPLRLGLVIGMFVIIMGIIFLDIYFMTP